VGIAKICLRCHRLDTFPPVRRNTLATLSVNRYGGNLSMTARYDSTSWSSEDAAAFLQDFMNRLTNEPMKLTTVDGLVAKQV
jgi:hypothetical protein